MKKPYKSLIYPLFIPNEACPGGCIYCDQSKISRAGIFDLEEARVQVQAFIRRNPKRSKEVAFYGGSFTGIDMEMQENLLSVPLKYKEKGKIDEIRLSTRPDYINKKVFT